MKPMITTKNLADVFNKFKTALLYARFFVSVGIGEVLWKIKIYHAQRMPKVYAAILKKQDTPPPPCKPKSRFRIMVDRCVSDHLKHMDGKCNKFEALKAGFNFGTDPHYQDTSLPYLHKPNTHPYPYDRYKMIEDADKMIELVSKSAPPYVHKKDKATSGKKKATKKSKSK